jgi:hypothetical protein
MPQRPCLELSSLSCPRNIKELLHPVLVVGICALELNELIISLKNPRTVVALVVISSTTLAFFFVDSTTGDVALILLLL